MSKAERVLDVKTIPVMEYKTIPDVIDGKLETELNAIARQGWKLEQIVRGPGSWTLIMVRETLFVTELVPTVELPEGG